MAEVIRMPRMSDTMEEGVIVGWLKQVGDKVEPGDVLAEVETDKATMELESFQEGTLLYIGVKEGSVPVNGVLAVIGEKGEDYQAALDKSSNGNGTDKEVPADDKKENAADGDTKSSENGGQKQEVTAVDAKEGSSQEKRVKASPLAKSMASEAGVDLKTLKGSGDNGRIVKRDVEAFLEGEPAEATKKVDISTEDGKPDVQPFTYGTDGDNYEDVPVSQMRKVIAKRLGESKFSAPHFYLTIEVNMDEAIAARKRINEIAPVKISFNDLVVKSCAVALRQHPAVNSSWLGDKIRKNYNINIGVAVAVDEGLLVPVIRHADLKSLSQINVEVKELADKAKGKKLQPDQMQGNTFTVSNLGMLGIEEFTAIINPPDACILAVGSIVEKPIVKNGELAIGNMMKVTLSCDHRVVDGATGARFLQTLQSILEDPIRLVV